MYERVLDRYVETGSIPFSQPLAPKPPVAESLATVPDAAALPLRGESKGCHRKIMSFIPEGITPLLRGQRYRRHTHLQ